MAGAAVAAILKWDQRFESAFLQRGVKNELLVDAAPLAVSSPNGRLSKGRVPRDIGDYMAFREIFLLISAATGGKMWSSSDRLLLSLRSRLSPLDQAKPAPRRHRQLENLWHRAE